MPASKAQQRATNKYIAKAYDRINLTVPKGKKDTIQAHAEAQGQSVNAYINTAIDEKMSREVAGSPTRPAPSEMNSDITEGRNAVLGQSEDRTEGVGGEGPQNEPI